LIKIKEKRVTMGSVVVSREKIGNGLQNHSGLIKIERVDALLDVSVDLGTEHEAHVIGLYVIPGPAVYPAIGPYAVPK
jgi:hypothetical protein